MAILQLSNQFSSIRGSINGATYQNTRAGLIVRRKPIPKRNYSTKKSIVIANHMKLVKNYQLLPLTNKLVWDAFALANPHTNKYGTVVELTGQNYYELVNSNYEQIGQAAVDNPQGNTIPNSPQSYNGCLQNDELIINNPYPTDPTNHSIFIWTTPPNSRATSSIWSILRLTKVLNNDPAADINLTADYNATHNFTLDTSIYTNAFTIGIAVQSIQKTSGFKSASVYLIQAFNECDI